MSQFIRTLQRKFGISAPRVAVRTHIAWYWRWLGYVALGAFVVGVGWTTYDYGMELAGFRQSEAAQALARLNGEIRQRDARILELRSQVAAAERQMQIERATYGDLAKQVKSLAEENAVLREDLGFFQSLMAAGGKEGALSINRFRVQPEALPGEYRYRLLLVQNGQRVKEFQGTLQFVLNLEQGDRKFVLTLPQEGEPNSKEYQVSFKFFQRVEGTFKVAPGAVVKSLQIRVFENGSIAPKLSQSVSVS
ncbi:MAG TPA: DUF6776 family protein [Burkholderiales bacterium]|nr:DUF6776 family protein [Burkholderiales bacterium]